MRKETLDALDELLERDGGLYSSRDILDAINTGDMQSFVDGNDWVVTQIINAPRKRVMQIVFVYGDMEGLFRLEPVITEFAMDHGCKLIGASARVGFEKHMTEGWTKSSVNYRKELRRV
jgi:hypothetical protein